MCMLMYCTLLRGEKRKPGSNSREVVMRERRAWERKGDERESREIKESGREERE